MPPPLGPSQKDATPVPESPASSQHPFDFADLGRPRPKSVRTLPPVPQADASGQLEELSGDDILESDDIDALEAAAAGYSSFEVEAAEPYVAPQPAAAPAPEPSGFEVGDVGAFDEVEVEGSADPRDAAFCRAGAHRRGRGDRAGREGRRGGAECPRLR